MLLRDVVQEWVAELFAPFASFNLPGQIRPFHFKNMSPQLCVPDAFYLLSLPSSGLIHLCKDPFVGKSDVLLGHAEGRLAIGSRCSATDATRGGNH